MNWIAKECGLTGNKKIAFDRRQFVIDHKRECELAFMIGTKHKDWKTTPGRKLIKLARKDLDYSPGTYSGDIYYGVWKTFKELYLD